MLGTDGLILAAAAAWQNSDARSALAILVKAAGSVPPTLTFGAELGLRLAGAVPVALGPPAPGEPVIDYTAAGAGSQELIRIMNNWMPLMTQADASVASVSVPRTRNTSLDVSGARFFRRLRWRTWYWLSRRTYNKVLRPGISDYAFRLVTKGRSSMSQQPNPAESGKAAEADSRASSIFGRLQQGIAIPERVIFFLAPWGLASYFYVTQNSSPALSLIYGTVLAITFASASAVVASWIWNARLAESERRALAAERLAEQYRTDAAKGRALAAALLAGDVPAGPSASPGDDVRRQQAQFARLLFGDLVVNSPAGPNSSPRKS